MARGLRVAGPAERSQAGCGAIVRAGLPALIVAAPLWFGAVVPAAVVTLGLATAAVALALVGWKALAPERAGLRVGAAGWLGLAFAALVSLQLLPLSPSWIARLSPAAAGVYADVVPGFGGSADETRSLEQRVLPEEARPAAAAPPRESRPLSLDPRATRSALVKAAWYLVLFLLALNATPRPVPWRWAILALVGVGVFESAYGLAEHLSRHQHIFGFAKRHYTDAVTGTYINRNHFAGLLELALPAGLGLLLSLRRRSPEAASRGSALRGLVVRFAQRRGAQATLLALGCAVMATALLLSFSRAGIFLGLLALGLTASLARPAGQGLLLRALPVVLIVASASVPAYVAGSAHLAERYGALLSDGPAEDGRWDVWGRALALGLDFPVAGAGLGTFAGVFPGYRPPRTGFFDHAHNDYLELFAEAGGIGLALVLGAAAACLLAAGRSLRAAGPRRRALLAGLGAGMVALLAHGLVDFNGQIPANAGLLACAAGLAVSLSRSTAPARPRVRLRETPAGAAALAAATAGVLLFASLAWIDWDREGRHARVLREVRSRLSGGPDAAGRQAAEALARLDGGAETARPLPEALTLRARFRLLQAGPPGEAPHVEEVAAPETAGIHAAYVDARRAMQEQPANAEHALVAALALQTAEVHGALAEGVEPGAPEVEELVGRLLARAARLDPSNPTRRRTLGTLYLARGRTEEAVEEYAASLRAGAGHAGEIYAALWPMPDGPALVDRVTPADPVGRLMLARFHHHGGRYAEAEGLYREAARDPRFGLEATEGLAGVLIRQRRFEEASSLCDSFEETLPAATGRVALWRGRLAMHRGDRHAAVAHFEAALRADPDSEEIQWALAEAFCERGDDQPCIARLTLLLEEGSPGFVHRQEKALRLLLARALERQGRVEESLAQYLLVSSMEPQNREAGAAVERLRHRL